MRNLLPLLSCLASLLSVVLPAGPPALAQPSRAVQPVSPGLPPEDPEKSSIGVVDAPTPDCHPIYAAGVHEVGPPMVEPEKRTQGLVITGFACEPRR